MKILLFIPTFNCEHQIARVFNRFDESNLKNVFQILIIDNKSTDATALFTKTSIESLKSRTKFKNVVHIVNESNIGFGGSHKKAFRYGIENHYDYFLVLHGDDQARIDDFKNELALLNQKSGHIFGSRFALKAKRHNYSKVRTFGNILFNGLASATTFKNISDLGGSGLNLYCLSCLKECRDYEEFPNDLTFHVRLLLYTIRQKQPHRYIPINWQEIDQISSVRVIRQGLTVLRLILGDLLTR